LTEDYANICGIAIEDLDRYFSENIRYLSTLRSLKRYDSIHDEILSWYDGYSWDGENRVINPFSLLSFFKQKRFSSFCYASGTPKFLIDVMKKKPEACVNIEKPEMAEWELDAFDIRNIEAESLLFQTGYLTVKKILETAEEPIYLLDMPNVEVRKAFNMHILAEFTEKGASFTGSACRRINEFLKTGDIQSMLGILRGLFASIPYQLHIDREAYYHSIFYAVMSVLGFDIDVEVSNSRDRIDAALELDDKVYIIEFKYKDCAPNASDEDKKKLCAKALEEGMEQLKNRGYADKYAGSGKTIYQAAFAFLGRDEIEMIASS
jgi:hypothetical protein